MKQTAGLLLSLSIIHRRLPNYAHGRLMSLQRMLQKKPEMKVYFTQVHVGPLKLTHEALTISTAEVSAIVNARPLIPVSTDPEAPFILTPSMLLTLKTGAAPCPASEFSKGVLLKNQWKRVQDLEEAFWARWRQKDLNTLQQRQKCQAPKPNLEKGDIVLLKDSQTSARSKVG